MSVMKLECQLTDLHFNNIGAWPSWIRFGVMGLWALIFISIMYGFDLSERLEGLKQVKKTRTLLEKQWMNEQSQLKNLSFIRNQTIQENKILEEKWLVFPGHIAVSEIIENISQLASHRGLKMKDFHPSGEKYSTGMVRVPLRMSAVGHYQAFSKFINDLVSQSNIVTVENFNLRVINENNNEISSAHSKYLILDLKLNIYFRDKKIATENFDGLIAPQKPRKVPMRYALTCNPFLSHHCKNTTSTDPLQSFPLTRLKMVGYFSLGQEKYGLIMIPSGAVYSLKIGETIGNHLGRVNSISPTQIEVIEPPEKFRKLSFEKK